MVGHVSQIVVAVFLVVQGINSAVVTRNVA